MVDSTEFSDAEGADQFRSGMRHLCTGVTIIATGAGEARKGLAASAVCSVSGEPPMLLVCVNQNASAHDSILDSGAFCANVLARPHSELAKIYSSSKRADERFATGEWITLTTGAPALADALACFDCRVHHTIEAGSHTVIFGVVEAMHRGAERPPLLYGYSQFGAYAPIGF